MNYKVRMTTNKVIGLYYRRLQSSAADQVAFSGRDTPKIAGDPLVGLAVREAIPA